MRRLDVKLKNKILKKIWQNLSLITLYKHLALYGESYIRLLIWSIIIVTIFTTLRILTEGSGSTEPASTLLTHLSNSARAFLQLPREPTTKLDIAERIFSAPILGLLLVSLKRRFERK